MFSRVQMGRLMSRIKEGVGGKAAAAPQGRGVAGAVAAAAKKAALMKGNAMKKGGAVKKSSDAMGRAVKRKTADVKGRAIKKGK